MLDVMIVIAGNGEAGHRSNQWSEDLIGQNEFAVGAQRGGVPGEQDSIEAASR